MTTWKRRTMLAVLALTMLPVCDDLVPCPQGTIMVGVRETYLGWRGVCRIPPPACSCGPLGTPGMLDEDGRFIPSEVGP